MDTPEETLELPGQTDEHEPAFGVTAISRHNETVVFDITMPSEQGEMVLDRGWLLGQLEERQDQEQVAITGEVPERRLVVGMWVDGLLEVLCRQFPERYVSWLKPMATTEAPSLPAADPTMARKAYKRVSLEIPEPAD